MHHASSSLLSATGEPPRSAATPHELAGPSRRLLDPISHGLRLTLLALIRAYQTLISGGLPPACRFEPSCSRYAYAAIERYGALRGGWLALRRLARCQPWGGSGYDPVP